LLLLPSLACGDDDGRTGPDPDPEEPVATSLSITPAGASLAVIGDTVRLDAEVRDQKGDAITSVTVSWSTLDPAVATVDNDGLVTAAAVGTARIAASTGELADTAVVSVERAPAGIAIEPTALHLAQGDTVRLSAVILDASGVAIEDAVVVWSGEVGTIASVDPTGLVTAGARGGEARITATAGDAADTVVVQVMDLLAFTSLRDGDAEIYVMNDDGSGQTHLTNDPSGSDHQPVWSPDGTKTAFIRIVGAETEIYVMNADGARGCAGARRRVCRRPSVGPSGRMPTRPPSDPDPTRGGPPCSVSPASWP